MDSIDKLVVQGLPPREAFFNVLIEVTLQKQIEEPEEAMQNLYTEHLNAKRYVLEVDLEIPSSQHERQNDWRMAPEYLTITYEMLSSYCSSKSGGPDCISLRGYEVDPDFVTYGDTSPYRLLILWRFLALRLVSSSSRFPGDGSTSSEKRAQPEVTTSRLVRDGVFGR
ncbi:hypothetical protein CDAR_566851 [Caerostris darwini]|uniref:Uncharacterized protein n=1 Tax=Caerostris darwini TaxID=1538125 RepID=A0AAV4VZG3_9ARAC|nr:hypothetical protein CDAR_566851 [Caerostris darwini]